MGNYKKKLQGYAWAGVETLKYKEEGTHFKEITRQIIFDGEPDLPCQWRYFEIAAGGYSTLERHRHVHMVMIIRGNGSALVDGQVHMLAPLDVVRIPPLTWHQFQATEGEPFGFLCLVNIERDKPQLPDESDLKTMRENPEVAAFIRV